MDISTRTGSADAWACRLLIASLCFNVILRIPHYQHEFMFVDEAWWAMGSKVVADGGRLYADFWMDKQPLIFWLGGLLFRLMGQSMAVLHGTAVALAIVTSLLLYLLGSRFYSPGVGGAAALFYSIASTTYYPRRIIGLNVESLMVPFMVAAMYAFLRAWQAGGRHWWFAAGLLSSLAAATKPVAGVQLVIFLALLVFLRPSPPPGRILSVCLLGAGYAAVWLGMAAVLSANGSLAAWWTQCIAYSVAYVHQIPARTFLKNLVFDPIAFAGIYLWLCLLIWRGFKDRELLAGSGWILAGWLLSDFVGMASGRRFYSNYHVQLWPSMCLLGGIGAVSAWNSRNSAFDRRLLRIAVAVLIPVFLWFHANTAAHWLFLASPGLHERVRPWGACREDRDLKEIAAYLEARTGKTDTLFIWGSRAELFWLADRRPAYYCVDYDVTADVPHRAEDPTTIGEAVRQLRLVLPKYIVDVQGHNPLETYPSFGELVRQAYLLETTLHGARLFRLQEAAR
jgi:hypothetical protein